MPSGWCEEQLFALWVPYVLGQRTEAVVSLDWTDFEADDQTTLVAALKTKHGRSTPLVWLTVPLLLPRQLAAGGAAPLERGHARTLHRGGARGEPRHGRAGARPGPAPPHRIGPNPAALLGRRVPNRGSPQGQGLSLAREAGGQA